MIDFKTIENQFHVNGADDELNRILKVILDWLPFDIENGFKTSEFFTSLCIHTSARIFQKLRICSENIVLSLVHIQRV